MTLDTTFTNGVIAVKEKQLLGEKLLRFPEMETGEVLRALSESGFGGGESEPDAVCSHEERVLDDFILTYAPSEADKAFFLAPRDFHNLKALEKAKRLGVSAENMLAPEGLYTVGELQKGVLPVPEIAEEATGAEIGAAYDGAMFSYLFKVCRLRPVLKKFLAMRADMTNILTAFRAADAQQAERLFLRGGKLGKKELSLLFAEDAVTREHALDKTPYAAFYRECLAAREKGDPFTAAERMKGTFEAKYFFDKKYNLQGKEPFLYYVFRRRAEIANVRTVLVCLRAGVDAREIGKRLVGVE